MSTLSAQCDELRAMAESVGLAMPQSATLMMEAADTIWELRGSVHRERAEAAKLRELVRDMFDCISHANEQDWFYFERDESGCGMSCTVNGEGCGLCVLADRMRELGIEVTT